MIWLYSTNNFTIGMVNVKHFVLNCKIVPDKYGNYATEPYDIVIKQP